MIVLVAWVRVAGVDGGVEQDGAWSMEEADGEWRMEEGGEGVA